MKKNQKKYNNVGFILIIVILLLLIIGLLIYIFVFNMNDNNKINSKSIKEIHKININQIMNDELNKTEQSILKKNYKYLVERLENIYSCSGIPFQKYLDNKIDNETKILTTIAGLDVEKVSFKKTDKFENSDKNDLTLLTSGYWTSPNDGYKISSIEKEIEKIYGKTTSLKYKSYPFLIYDKTIKAFVAIPGGCEPSQNIKQSVYKVEKEDNKIFIYVYVGLNYIDLNDENNTEKICYDYKIDDNTKCYNVSPLYENYGYTTKEGIEEIDYEKYMNNNKDRFSKYKYTFEKENENYIIKKLEKIS